MCHLSSSNPAFLKLGNCWEGNLTHGRKQQQERPLGVGREKEENEKGEARRNHAYTYTKLEGEG